MRSTVAGSFIFPVPPLVHRGLPDCGLSGPFLQRLTNPSAAVAGLISKNGSVTSLSGLTRPGRVMPGLITAGWSSPVARRPHKPKVAGSNPVLASNKKPDAGKERRAYQRNLSESLC